jgi:MazG family protein
MEHPELAALIKVIEKLRDPDGGCPWDLEQTHESLLKYLVEESYEYIHATEKGNKVEMEEELGDVLLQVLLHSTIAKQEKTFDLESVAKRLREKMIFRHPHVFGDKEVKDSEEVLKNWYELKSEEKQASSELDDSYLRMPALLSSYKIGKKTNKINFDWDNADQVFEKVQEEWAEFSEELAKSSDHVEEEFGDFMFSLAQWARHRGFDPEESLRKANQKFLRRFRKMEGLMAKESIEFKKSTQKELDVFWNEVKKEEKS